MNIEDIINIKSGSTIRHERSGVAYAFLGVGKVKVNGRWLNSGVYRCFDSGKIYCRLADDFKGFERG